jgi:hypothetical protein
MKKLIFTIVAAVALHAADNPKAKILKETDEQFCKTSSRRAWKVG